MSNDNKTLVGAQPGGMVRLGEQAERARFEAWASSRTYSVEASAGVYDEQVTRRIWAAWQAALSAQPSPGGQDAQALLQRYDAASAKFRESLMDHHYSDELREERRLRFTAIKDELLASLAARQPVECKHCDGSGSIHGTDCGGCQPVGQEPVAECLTGGDIGRLPAGRGLRPGTKLYAAPPAQADDLWQFREAIYYATLNMRGQINGGVHLISLENLLALIDSKVMDLKE